MPKRPSTPHAEKGPQLCRALLVADHQATSTRALKAQGAMAFGEFYAAAISEMAGTRREGLFL